MRRPREPRRRERRMDFGVSPMVRAKAPNWIIVIGKFVARHIAISCVLLVFAFGVLIAPWGRPVSGVPRNAGEIWRSGFWWTGWAIGVAFISVGVLLSVTPYLYFASIPGSFLQLLGVYVCVLLSVHALAALTSMRGFFYRGRSPERWNESTGEDNIVNVMHGLLELIQFLTLSLLQSKSLAGQHTPTFLPYLLLHVPIESLTLALIASAIIVHFFLFGCYAGTTSAPSNPFTSHVPVDVLGDALALPVSLQLLSFMVIGGTVPKQHISAAMALLFAFNGSLAFFPLFRLDDNDQPDGRTRTSVMVRMVKVCSAVIARFCLEKAVIFNVIEALLMCAGLVSISVFHPSGGGKSFRVLCWIIPLWSFLCTVGDLAGLWTASIVVLVTGLIILVVIALLVKLVVRCWQKRKSALSVYALPIHIDREDSAMQADEVVSMASVGDTESNLAVFHVNERSVLEVLPMASPALMERADHASVAQQSSSRDSAVSANCLMGAMVAMPALDAIISNGVDDPHSSESPSPTPSDVMLSHIQEDASDGSHADPFAHLSVDAGSDEDYFRKDDVANRYAAPSTAERSYTESPHSAMSRSSGYSEEGTPDAPSQHSQYTSEGNHTGRTVSTRTAV